MTHRFLPEFWRDLGEDGDAVDLVRTDGSDVLPLLPSPLPVGILAHDAVAAAALEAAQLTGTPGPLALDARRVASAYTGERHFRIDGAAPNWWAELSGFWPTGDGWLRTHANYPHHRRRLLSALGLRDDSGREALLAALAELPALEAEERIVGAEGVAAAVRTPAEWAHSEQGQAVAGAPALQLGRLREGRERPLPAPRPQAPLDGVRVLDLTRVIAGPVATGTLALLGADVLRIDPPDLPEPEPQWLLTGMGKRSALLDVRREQDELDRLIQDADVVVTGYRPGSLDRLGLAPESLAERRPGVVVARLTAWGNTGPWAGRRGFDSIVQAATGIAAETGTPGALPAQALDHSAGYLLAAAVLALLRRRTERGGSWVAETSLAGLAAALLAAPRPHPAVAVPLVPEVLERDTPSGRLSYPAPALPSPPAADDWAEVGALWGAAQPAWRGLIGPS
ncbi:CoA transferase [Naasia sp. SYSU D00948]|uniref:CoA transferase n=1 Tax=Naasia sp. SYSU D00948 TaxID=2817379 RepID=UPI001B309263|nr:CoA transferase [Naasia sp. SYSU D00948]